MKPNFWDKIFIIISKETSFSSGNILHVCICIVQYYIILIVVLFNQNYKKYFFFFLHWILKVSLCCFVGLSCLSPISWTYKNQKLKTNLSDKVLIRAIYVLISVLLSEKDNAFISSEHPKHSIRDVAKRNFYFSVKIFAACFVNFFCQNFTKGTNF